MIIKSKEVNRVEYLKKEINKHIYHLTFRMLLYMSHETFPLAYLTSFYINTCINCDFLLLFYPVMFPCKKKSFPFSSFKTPFMCLLFKKVFFSCVWLGTSPLWSSAITQIKLYWQDVYLTPSTSRVRILLYKGTFLIYFYVLKHKILYLFKLCQHYNWFICTQINLMDTRCHS